MLADRLQRLPASIAAIPIPFHRDDMKLGGSAIDDQILEAIKYRITVVVDVRLKP